MRLSAVWYDVGYDIQSFKYGSALRNLDIFWAIYVLRSFFTFIAAKSRTVTMFFPVLIILVSQPTS